MGLLELCIHNLLCGSSTITRLSLGPPDTVRSIVGFTIFFCEQKGIEGGYHKYHGRKCGGGFQKLDSSKVYFPTERNGITGNGKISEVKDKMHEGENKKHYVSRLIFLDIFLLLYHNIVDMSKCFRERERRSYYYGQHCCKKRRRVWLLGL